MSKEIRTRVCPQCGELRFLTCFEKYPFSLNRYHPVCIDCEAEERDRLMSLRVGDLTNEMLLSEIKKRGFSGELNITRKITI